MRNEINSDLGSILIVTGSSSTARRDDSQAVHVLHQCLGRAMGLRSLAPSIMVVEDLCYLSNEVLMACPTITVGGPCSNHATVYLYEQIPHSLILAGTAMIQMSNTLDDFRACLWGKGSYGTATAVELFVTRGHMNRFIQKINVATTQIA